MSDDEPAPAERTLVELEKEIARLRRRLNRVETQLEQIEVIRDTNAKALGNASSELAAEKARSRALLLNVLPEAIIERLDKGEQLIADRYDDVAIVFSDFVGFTEISARLEVATLVTSLNGLFSAFDAACGAFGVEKIKTIGDAYMAAAGLPGTSDGTRTPGGHIRAAADLTLAMQAAVRAAGDPWRVRIGLHSGPVAAGVIGTSKFIYDLWGDAVNTASRLETTAPVGGIQVSATVAAALGDAYVLEPRGAIDLKGKGSTETFLLVGRRDA